MQQVEAALTSDPTNAELLTLKADLQQVIDLTEELISEQSKASSSSFESSAEAGASTSEILESSSEKKSRPHDNWKPIKHWQVGESCQFPQEPSPPSAQKSWINSNWTRSRIELWIGF